MFTEAKRKFLIGKLGAARVRKLEEELPALTKELEARGIRWKDLDADDEPDLVTALKQSKAPAAKYALDLIAGRVVKGD